MLFLRIAVEGGPARDPFILTSNLFLIDNRSCVFLCCEWDVVIEDVVVRGHPWYVIVVIRAIFDRPGVAMAVRVHFRVHYLRLRTEKLLSFTGGCQKPLPDIWGHRGSVVGCQVARPFLLRTTLWNDQLCRPSLWVSHLNLSRLLCFVLSLACRLLWEYLSKCRFLINYININKCKKT